TKITAGLKEALQIGAQNAVKATGRTDGYLANHAIKILMPDELRRAERTLRAVGFGEQVDDFIVSMNRAAERAAPAALAIDLDAYVVSKALDGLFHVLGDEERKIRTDPAARITALLRDVFGP